MCNRRKDSLCTLACISAPDTVYVKTWTDSGTFKRSITLFSFDLIYIKELLIFIKIKRCT